MSQTNYRLERTAVVVGHIRWNDIDARVRDEGGREWAHKEQAVGRPAQHRGGEGRRHTPEGGIRQQPGSIHSISR
jgi:hypothetical protein